MNEIKITQTNEFLSTEIPKHCIPKRFAVATNILLCAPINKDEKGFLLFNYEPKKWNQWYPFFSSVNNYYDFKGTKYIDIINEFNTNIFNKDEVKDRIIKTKSEFLQLIGLTDKQLEITNSSINPEFSLKFSKTQNVWTLYYIEFFQVFKISRNIFNSIDHQTTCFMPLNKAVINEVLNTGKYNDIDVVDNTLEILRNTKLLKDLTCIMID